MAPINTTPTFDQAKRMLEFFSELNLDTDQIQNFLGAGDLVKRMLFTDLARVDRQAFAQLLAAVDEASRFDPGRYQHLLLSLPEQLERLKRYDTQYWDGRMKKTLKSVDVSGDHTQSVQDLEFFHVVFDSLEETVEMWWRVYQGEQPAHYRAPDDKLDTKHLKLWDSNVRQYEPGVHRVRVNLVAHWEPDTGRTLDQVRDKAKASGEILAQLEPMSAYGIHTELFREQDGEKLPYPDMPGTVVKVPGISRSYALYVRWHPIRRKAYLNAGWTDGVLYYWVAPVLLGE